MVGQRLKGYLESCGLAAEDVPKVLGAFVTAKYCTWAGAVVLGVRCQPLRRLLLARRDAVTGAMRPWATQQHKWVVEALDKARKSPSGAARRYHDAKASVGAAKGRLHSAGQELLRRQQLLKAQLQQQALQRRESGWRGIHTWLSANYWKLSDKLESAASSGRVSSFLSNNLHLNPRGFAMGVAEGTILYKSTFLLHAPFQLYLIVQLFKRRRGALLLDSSDCGQEHKGKEGEEEKEEEGNHGQGYQMEASRVMAAVRDANELAHERMGVYGDGFGLV